MNLCSPSQETRGGLGGGVGVMKLTWFQPSSPLPDSNTSILPLGWPPPADSGSSKMGPLSPFFFPFCAAPLIHPPPTARPQRWDVGFGYRMQKQPVGGTSDDVLSHNPSMSDGVCVWARTVLQVSQAACMLVLPTFPSSLVVGVAIKEKKKPYFCHCGVLKWVNCCSELQTHIFPCYTRVGGCVRPDHSEPLCVGWAETTSCVSMPTQLVDRARIFFFYLHVYAL